MTANPIALAIDAARYALWPASGTPEGAALLLPPEVSPPILFAVTLVVIVLLTLLSQRFFAFLQGDLAEAI